MIIINHDVGFPATINEEMKDLILKMLHKEEDERIEIEEILLRLNHLK